MNWLTAEEALSILQTKPQTLYANVSRGRIRSKPLPDDPRRSLYRSDDVHRLAERRPGRKETALLLPILFVGGFPSCVRAFRPLSTVACSIAVVTRSNCPKQQPWKKWPLCYGK